MIATERRSVSFQPTQMLTEEGIQEKIRLKFEKIEARSIKRLKKRILANTVLAATGDAVEARARRNRNEYRGDFNKAVLELYSEGKIRIRQDRRLQRIRPGELPPAHYP